VAEGVGPEFKPQYHKKRKGMSIWVSPLIETGPTEGVEFNYNIL
jgi:hypothetical protein